MSSRREFIEKLSITAISVPLLYSPAQLFAASSEPYEGPILKVAIMGLGSYGTRVAEAMQSCTRAKLVGVISGTPSKIKKWQSKYDIPEKNCYNYDNFDAIKNNPDIIKKFLV